MIKVSFDPRPELSQRKDRRFILAAMTGVFAGQLASQILLNDATIRAHLTVWTCALITGLVTGAIILLMAALLGLPLRITFAKKTRSDHAPDSGPGPAANA